MNLHEPAITARPPNPLGSLQCRLCVELHNRVTLATVRATVPMAGERPRYGLCDDCLAELSEYVEDVEVVA